MDKNRLPVILKSRLPTTETRSTSGTSRKPKTTSKNARRGIRLAAVLLGILLLVALLCWLTPKLIPDEANTYPIFLFLIHQSFPPSSTGTPPQNTDTDISTDTSASPAATTSPETVGDTEESSVHTEESAEATATSKPETATESEEPSDVTESSSEVHETSTEESTAPDTESQESPQPPQVPDHSDESYSSLGAHHLSNTTVLAPDVKALVKDPFPEINAILLITSRPSDSYAEGDGNVGDLARLIKERLSHKDIQVVYADAPSGADAQAVVDYYLSLYPEINLVLDLRRSAEPDGKGGLLRPLCFLGGEQNIPCAQVRFICDSRGVGADMTEQNLSLALHLRTDIFDIDQQLSRPVWLREGQSLGGNGVFFLTVEIGAAGNSFAEAVTAADILAGVLCGRIGQNT